MTTNSIRRAAVRCAFVVTLLSCGAHSQAMPASAHALFAARATADDAATPVPSLQDSLLSLSEALALAVSGNPELAAFSWDLRAAEARRIQAAARPNPELGFELENVSGDLPGLSQSELTLSLGQILELGGKRDVRMRAARAEEGVRAREWEMLELAVSAEVTRRFLDAMTTDRLVELQEEEVRIADQIRTSVGQRVRAGSISPAEQLRAELELQNARLELRDLQEERNLSYEGLASLWGATDPGSIRVVGMLDSAAAVPPRDVLLQRIEQSPELAVRASEIAAREARLELARAERAPDLGVELGYRRLQGEKANTFLGAVTLPLPLFDRKEGEIALAEAEARGAQASADRARIEMARALSEGHGRAARAGARARALTSEILPNAERTFEEIQTGYEQGRFSYVDLLEARRAWTEARRERVRALSDYHHAIADLELLLGGPVRSDFSPEGQP
jgi:cobalt-zinc-cadmium efflux system outer membrane protein